MYVLYVDTYCYKYGVPFRGECNNTDMNGKLYTYIIYSIYTHIQVVLILSEEL